MSLHGPGCLAAPFAAAITQLPPRSSLMPGAVVSRHGDRILFGPFVLGGGGGTLADTRIQPVDGGIDLLVSALAAPEMPSAASSLFFRAGRGALGRMADGIRYGNPQVFVEGACGLIGLGEGLTPAGDDCLVGALAILHRFARPWLARHSEIRPPIAAAARGGTTIVGRDFILHALDGAFSEHVLALVAAESVKDVRRAATRLAATGATSGADTLCGIRLALEALRR